jgi:hypothetical protein
MDNTQKTTSPFVPYDCFTYLLRIILKIYLEISAFFLRKKFYCLSLQGKSHYGISINCDLSVSCNCADIFGNGIIGNLKHQTLDQIFSSDRVLKFKQRLSRGRLAIIDCATCIELRASKQVPDLKSTGSPEKIIIENTINCPLQCLSCKRERIKKLRTQSSLTSDDIKLLSKTIKNAGVKLIFFFNQGEPFSSDMIKEEITTLRHDNPHVFIKTSTNGMAIDSKEKAEAAQLMDHIIFSLDGPDQKTVSRYQRGINFHVVLNKMKELKELRGSREKPVIEWKYVLFRWNDSPSCLNKAMKLAQEAKIDMISFCKTSYPLYGISYRYYLGFKYFKNIGRPSLKGREVDFRKMQSSSRLPKNISQPPETPSPL